MFSNVKIQLPTCMLTDTSCGPVHVLVQIDFHQNMSAELEYQIIQIDIMAKTAEWHQSTLQ